MIDPSVIQTIKDYTTMDDVVLALNIGPIPRNRKMSSPWSADSEPSLHFYRDNWYDYSTGKSGDQIKFVMEYTGCRFPEAVQLLASGIGVVTGPPPVQKEAPPPDLTDYWHKIPEPAAYDLAALSSLARRKWGLTGEEVLSIPTNKIGPLYLYTAHHDPHLPFVRGIKKRFLIHGDKSAIKGSKFTYGLYWTRYEGEKLLLLEGESDAWVAHHRFPEYAVAALPSGANVIHEDWFKYWTHDDVILSFDDDEAGQTATSKVFDILDLQTRVRSIMPPSGRFAEAVKEGWRP